MIGCYFAALPSKAHGVSSQTHSKILDVCRNPLTRTMQPLGTQLNAPHEVQGPCSASCSFSASSFFSSSSAPPFPTLPPRQRPLVRPCYCCRRRQLHGPRFRRRGPVMVPQGLSLHNPHQRHHRRKCSSCTCWSVSGAGAGAALAAKSLE